MKFLADVNFWLALTFESHAKHLTAKQWFADNGQDGVCFCRLTQQAFLRLSTNSKVMKADVVSMVQAWTLYDTILSDSRISFVDETASVEQQWRSLTQLKTFSTNVWSDAWLAAMAIRLGVEIVTFDKGFVAYPNLKHSIL